VPTLRVMTQTEEKSKITSLGLFERFEKLPAEPRDSSATGEGGEKKSREQSVSTSQWPRKKCEKLSGRGERGIRVGSGDKNGEEN